MQEQSCLRLRMPAALVTVSAVLWFALFPLYNDLSYSHITRAKWQCMIVLTAVTAALLIVSVVLCLLRRPRRRAPFTVVQGLASAYFLWVGLSALFGRLADSVNPTGALTVWMGAIRYEGMATQLCYAAIFLCMSVYPPKMRWVLHGAAAAMLLYCGVVALQYADMNPLTLFPAGLSTRTNYEFQGTIGNIDMVSGYLTLLVPLLLTGYVCGRHRTDAVWLTAGLAGLLLELCMTVQSGLIAMGLMLFLLALLLLAQPARRRRGMAVFAGACLMGAVRLSLAFPWLDGTEQVVFAPGIPSLILLLMAAVLTGLAVVLGRHPGRGMSTKAVVLTAVALMLAVLLLMALLPLPESMGGLYEIHEVLNGRGEDSFGSYRLGVWRQSLLMSRKSLLFGTGPDTFYDAMRAQLTESGAHLPETFDTPHNEYVSILCNNGLPALALYLLFLGALAWKAFRRQKSSAYLPPCLAAMACFAAQGFFSFSICLVTPMFWALLGILHSLSRREAPSSVSSQGGAA